MLESPLHSPDTIEDDNGDFWEDILAQILPGFFEAQDWLTRSGLVATCMRKNYLALEQSFYDHLTIFTDEFLVFTHF